LASEFSKKRKQKQEYDEHIIEVTDEAEYFKEKYNEMKDLLGNCTEQLRQFEELNALRNDVIEKLEKENQ
jgi:chromosome segregation ATPase